MSWLELRLRLEGSTAERAQDLLLELGAGSVSCTDAGNEPLFEPDPECLPLWRQVVVRALFAEDADLEAVQRQLIEAGFVAQADLAPPGKVEDQVWERAWMEHFRPMRFGRRLWILPHHAALPEDPEAVCLRLDPGLAFGTGTHPSTALCLQYLDENPPCGARVLDYGCGSGVLSLAALKLGAAQILALDHDPQALTATRENFAQNGVDGAALSLHDGDAGMAPVDLILANILSPTLIALAPRLRSLVKPGGRIVLSGILADQAEMVAAAYGPLLGPPRIQEGWALLCSSA